MDLKLLEICVEGPRLFFYYFGLYASITTIKQEEKLFQILSFDTY